GLIEPVADPEATSRDAGSPRVAPPAFATAVVSPISAPEPAPAAGKAATVSPRPPPAPAPPAPTPPAPTPPAPPPPPAADEQPPTLIEPLTPVTATNSGSLTNQSVETPLVATLTADDGV